MLKDFVIGWVTLIYDAIEYSEIPKHQYNLCNKQF